MNWRLASFARCISPLTMGNEASTCSFKRKNHRKFLPTDECRMDKLSAYSEVSPMQNIPYCFLAPKRQQPSKRVTFIDPSCVVHNRLAPHGEMRALEPPRLVMWGLYEPRTPPAHWPQIVQRERLRLMLRNQRTPMHRFPRRLFSHLRYSLPPTLREIPTGESDVLLPDASFETMAIGQDEGRANYGFSSEMDNVTLPRRTVFVIDTPGSAEAALTGNFVQENLVYCLERHDPFLEDNDAFSCEGTLPCDARREEFHRISLLSETDSGHDSVLACKSSPDVSHPNASTCTCNSRENKSTPCDVSFNHCSTQTDNENSKPSFIASHRENLRRQCISLQHSLKTLLSTLNENSQTTSVPELQSTDPERALNVAPFEEDNLSPFSTPFNQEPGTLDEYSVSNERLDEHKRSQESANVKESNNMIANYRGISERFGLKVQTQESSSPTSDARYKKVSDQSSDNFKCDQELSDKSEEKADSNQECHYHFRIVASKANLQLFKLSSLLSESASKTLFQIARETCCKIHLLPKKDYTGSVTKRTVLLQASRERYIKLCLKELSQHHPSLFFLS